jgi:hypothetical protein
MNLLADLRSPAVGSTRTDPIGSSPPALEQRRPASPGDKTSGPETVAGAGPGAASSHPALEQRRPASPGGKTSGPETVAGAGAASHHGCRN